MAVRNILITGGAGFIGSNLAKVLLSEGCNVRIVDNFNSQIHSNSNLSKDLYGHVELIIGDIRDRDLMKKALIGINGVVHLAAETGTGQSMYEIEKYFSVNIQGTAVLIDLIQNDNCAEKIDSLIIASSRSIYGEGLYKCQSHGDFYPPGRRDNDVLEGHYDFVCPKCEKFLISAPTPEIATLNPLSFYAITKLTQEQSILLLAKSKGINGFALRYQNVYGPGQSLKNPYTGILAVFSTLAKKNLSLNVFEDGQESRDFVYINDVTEATLRAIRFEGNYIGPVNIGFGDSHSVLSIANRINSYYGDMSKINVTGEFRKGDIRHNKADITKLKIVLNYTPKTPFSEGLQSFLEWTESQPAYDLSFEKSLQELKDKKLLIGRKVS